MGEGWRFSSSAFLTWGVAGSAFSSEAFDAGAAIAEGAASEGPSAAGLGCAGLASLLGGFLISRALLCLCPPFARGVTGDLGCSAGNCWWCCWAALFAKLFNSPVLGSFILIRVLRGRTNSELFGCEAGEGIGWYWSGGP